MYKCNSLPILNEPQTMTQGVKFVLAMFWAVGDTAVRNVFFERGLGEPFGAPVTAELHVCQCPFQE